MKYWEHIGINYLTLYWDKGYFVTFFKYSVFQMKL
jgi:hypothetical protein